MKSCLPSDIFSPYESGHNAAASTTNEKHRVYTEKDQRIAQLEQELAAFRAANHELQARLHHQTEAVQQQLESFSRELHDETAQYLTALSFSLKALENLCPFGSPGREALEIAKCNYQRMSDALHNLSMQLRPDSLIDLGLCPALVRHLEEWSKQHNIAVSFESTGLLKLYIAPEIETAIYRIVQEALTNIARHASATVVRVELHGNTGQAHATIQDDGCGFDVEAALSGSNRLGLRGMQERASLFSGTLKIESVIKQGTCIHVNIPLSETRSQPSEYLTAL